MSEALVEMTLIQQIWDLNEEEFEAVSQMQ